MKKNLLGILPLILAVFVLCGARAAAESPKPWPTHAPEATPYVRVYREEDAPHPTSAEGEPVSLTWDDLYEPFGHFHARAEELALFRSLPQDEPYSFVPHSLGFGLGEGESLRMAKLFDAQEGVEARVIAMKQLVSGLENWAFLTVVTTTPARLFELSGELDEPFLIEQFYEPVRLRFDIDYWPDGLYEESAALLAGYKVRGCLYFEDATLEKLKTADRGEVCEFSLRLFTPTGWSPDANGVLVDLRTRDGVTLSLYYKNESPESLCVASMTPSRLSVLSDALPGRYLVRLAEEENLADYDGVLHFTPEGEALEE